MFVVLDERLRLYSFPNHPFNAKRYDAFVEAFKQSQLFSIRSIKARKASKEELLLFHTESYIDFVKRKSNEGYGLLDYGDTPAFKGCYEAACYVVGAVLNAIDEALSKKENGFVPIAGLHHAYSNRASGFCIFNDVCVGINYLKRKGIEKILYFDLDAHHGDGVFYSFEDDPNVIIVDFHQMPLYPGTGAKEEIGKDKAKGTKLNIPLAPGSNDDDFKNAIKEAEDFLKNFKVNFIIFQAGVDSMANDALASLQFKKAHSMATEFLLKYAKSCKAHVLACGGGGYSIDNIKDGWMQVVRTMVKYS
jgi:acetoin utilization protein AcuC